MTAIGVAVAGKTVTAAPTGFTVRGVLSATDQEAADGFGQVGPELAICVGTESALYPLLLDLRDRDVRVVVEPA